MEYMSKIDNRLKAIEDKLKSKHSRGRIVQLTFIDGSKVRTYEDPARVLNLICQGTDKTGLVDVAIYPPEEDNGFYEAFKDSETGKYPSADDYWNDEEEKSIEV